MTHTYLRPTAPRLLRTTAATAAIVFLTSACQQLPQKVTVDFAEPRVAASTTATQVAARPATGSLYQNVAYRPAFEDRRARQVGDTVTIQIAENVTASQKSTSTVNRNTSVDGAVTALPFNDITGLSKFNVGATTNNNFSGKGGTESANTFAGSITASVVEVLPNGHMVVTGEKQIGVNQNVDVLRFSGTVDPRMVQPGSVISSTQVANVRVESRGRGAQGEAQTVGWLSRFFLNVSPF
jgi:flagellar L-ring protein precursor FlgH